jgi:hypothetical protein
VDTKLNTPGQQFADLRGVHALTDVTGFGLAGHLLEICRGSKLAAEVRFDALPVIPEALEWVKQGVATGASDRNWKGYGAEIALPRSSPNGRRSFSPIRRRAAGLLVACAADCAGESAAGIQKAGIRTGACAIGRLSTGGGANPHPVSAVCGVSDLAIRRRKKTRSCVKRLARCIASVSKMLTRETAPLALARKPCGNACCGELRRQLCTTPALSRLLRLGISLACFQSLASSQTVAGSTPGSIPRSRRAGRRSTALRSRCLRYRRHGAQARACL